jgi:hypothetical protein
MYVLATIIHDPESRLLPLLRRLPDLLQNYDSSTAIATPSTAPAVLAALRAAGVHLAVGASDAGIGVHRRAAVRAGLDLGAAHVHYCDLDRALHWAANFPEELAGVRQAIEGCDYLMLGRTERAFATHPPVQQAPERLTNLALSAALGRVVDATAGSCGLSRAAAEWLLPRSAAATNATDTEWPALLHFAPRHFRLDHRATEGLEFETPDLYPAEIAAAGSRAAWLAARSRPFEAWLARSRLAWDSIAAIERVRLTA